MVEVLPLQHHAQLTVIQALLDHLDNIDENQIKYIVKLFQTQSFTPVSEQVLKRLVTYYPHKLTNQILTALVPPHVCQLVLKSCTSVSFKGLSETLKKCKHLQFLDLTQCAYLMLPDLFTYAGLISPSLTSISVDHCDTVTDEVVQAMLQGISALRHLSVSGCLNLTDNVFLVNEKLQGTREAFCSVRSVMDLDYECHLVSVDISGCRKLTSTAIRHLCTLCGPTLKSINISWIQADCTALLYLSGYDHLAVSCVLSLFDVAQQSKDKFSQVLLEILQELHNLADNYSSELRAQKLRKLVSAKDEVDSTSKSTLSAKNQAKISVKNIPIDEEEEKTTNAVKSQDANFIKPNCLEDTDCIISHESVNIEFENLIEHSDTKQILQAESLQLLTLEGSTNVDCITEKQMMSSLENNGCTNSYHFHEERVQLEVNVGERDSVLVTLNDQHSEMKEFFNHDVNNAGTTQKNGTSQANDDTGSTLLTDNGSNLLKTCAEVSTICENITEEELPKVSDNLSTRLFSLSVDDAVLSTKGMSDSSLNKNKVPVISCKGMSSVDDDFFLSVNNSDVLKRGILHKEVDNTDSNQDIRNSGSAEENMSGLFDKPKTVDCFQALQSSSLHDGDISKIEFSSKDVIQNTDVISQDTAEPSSMKNVEDTGMLMSFECMDPFRSQNYGTSKPAVERVFTSPILRILNSVNSSIFQRQNSITSLLSIKELETIFQQIYTPELSSLDMTDIIYHNKSRDEFCLLVFFEINKSLRKFGISWKELSDEILDRISASSPNLCEIVLVECGYLSTSGVSNLGLNCQQLQKVDLKGVFVIGDRAVAPLLTLPGLESLVLSGSEITDKTLNTISKGRCALKLKELDLCWCEEITEKGINMVCSECHSLESLHLKKCPVTDLSVTLLAENCPRMKVLVISSVTDITDASVIYLSEHLHQLQELDISWNLALTNESVSAILKNCPQLHTACMSGLKQITAEPFLPIITDLKRWRRCQSLLRFKLHEKKIFEENNESNYSSDEEFEELYLPHRSQVYTPNLRTLLLEYSDLVNDTQLSEIVAVCRGSLQIIDYYGEQMKPALIHYKKGKQYLPPHM
ncbi:hypothetical protein CHS0354_003448 [Potamilus streckersoni]|uniref:F-box/LRR-repeat protein 15-like leucin rich repeat domain-containing protein n=1 Tax=Potamilus streckersoni TaxID=2493646 RepID=A0AAE0VZ26_9BIVA|nr:hypothetical protein CHS0354_003448 [Potamilus streckersoni]